MRRRTFARLGSSGAPLGEGGPAPDEPGGPDGAGSTSMGVGSLRLAEGVVGVDAG